MSKFQSCRMFGVRTEIQAKIKFLQNRDFSLCLVHFQIFNNNKVPLLTNLTYTNAPYSLWLECGVSHYLAYSPVRPKSRKH